jgi:hypothetical protein
MGDFALHGRREKPVSAGFLLLAGTAAFAAYFAMYAFRKPFSVAQFEDVTGWGFALSYKSALLIAQIVGYALAKIVGIKIIAELKREQSAIAILALIGVAWLSLVLFALLPPPWNIALLFLNGIPLGMIWGLIFIFLEGRRSSDLLGAMLCVSLIVASGVVKSVGAWVMLQGVSEYWMPAATGVLFFPLLFAAVYVLNRLPPPDAVDKAARTARKPMLAHERNAFLKRHALLLAVLVLAYVAITALRDFRDNFAPELWSQMGFAKDPALFSASELPIGFIVLLSLGLLVLVRNNGRALMLVIAMITFGMLLLGGSTLAFANGLLTPMAWMILSGLGLYLAYTPFNALLFDRLIALFGQPGNAGFLIYVADACGYVGSVGLMLYRNFGAPKLDWLNFYIACCIATAILVALCALVAGWLIARRRASGAL